MSRLLCQRGPKTKAAQAFDNINGMALWTKVVQAGKGGRATESRCNCVSLDGYGFVDSRRGREAGRRGINNGLEGKRQGGWKQKW